MGKNDQVHSAKVRPAETPTAPPDKGAGWSGDKPGKEGPYHGKKEVIVCGKFRMGLEKSDLMGEGTSSICRKGTHVDTGEQVAIKVYKTSKDGKQETNLQKFVRQIQVLKQLLEPFEEPADKTLWHADLDASKPSRLFIQLIDYSKNEKGDPAPDAEDGQMYVITELAQYSLKDYIAQRREQQKALPADLVRKIAKAIVHVMAGLHAKGLVHLDLKPENMMMFKGRLKLIDVDGCVKIGSSISIHDSSISFSPCYCAPEWAKFLIDDTDGNAHIAIHPCLDVWSGGMAICELVTLDAVLKPMYAKFLRTGNSHREAGFLFMDYLSSIKTAPIPKKVQDFDPQFFEFLNEFLLVCHPGKRKSFAQALSAPYLRALADEDKVTSSKTPSRQEMVVHKHSSHDLLKTSGPDAGEVVHHAIRSREEDHSSRAPLHTGTLWRLVAGHKPSDPLGWLKSDMWIASDGGLCYFSATDSKRLVLIDTARIVEARVSPLEGAARPHAFQMSVKEEEDQEVSHVFACDTQGEYDVWLAKLETARSLDHVPSIQLGENFAKELAGVKLKVKNRRLKVEGDDKDQFAPVFKAKLWKVKAEGDRMQPQDWFEREMWISKNGSLVYWSKKEERDLVYYTSEDIAHASLCKVSNEDSFRPWTFQVRLPITNGVEFAPGEFAAETEETREIWLKQLAAFKVD